LAVLSTTCCRTERGEASWGGGVHGLEGTAAGALLAGVRDLSLGVNGSVDDDDDRVLELLLEVVNDRA